MLRLASSSMAGNTGDLRIRTLGPVAATLHVNAGSNMPDRQISRYLQAKRVRFKSGRVKTPIVYPAIDVLLRQIIMKAPHWAQRHDPLPPTPPEVIAPGKQCAFLTLIANRAGGDGKGVYFEVGTYVHGLAHDQTTLDFSQPDAEVLSEKLPQAGSSDRALTSVIRGVALGEIMILESSRGSGGYNLAQKLIGKLIQRFCVKPPPLPGKPPHENPYWPSIELMDVMSGDLKAEIERGGGVERLYLRVAAGHESPDDSWAYKLRSQMAQLSNATRFHAIWEAEDNMLSTDDVMTAVEEAEDETSGLDKITIELKNESRITKLDRFKIRKEVKVRVDSAGKIYRSDIVDGLWQFLDHLRKTNSDLWRLIDDDGYFTTHATISVKAKK